MKNNSTKKIILKLLNSISSEREIKKYLEKFSSDGPNFAIIKVGGAIIQNDIENLASALAFLNQVGLKPIIIHGAGPMLSSELDQRGIKYDFIDGKRVTSHSALMVAEELFKQENKKLLQALSANNVNAKPLLSNVFNCSISNKELGLVGDVQSINMEPINKLLNNGCLPIIAPLGITKDGQIVNINADIAAVALGKHIQPEKMIFLTETGGIIDSHQNIISTIYGLQQVNNLKKYGNTKAFFERNSTIHNLLNVWLPASKAIIGMPNTNLKGLNTIIGKEDDLHQIIGSPEVNDLKYIITDYQRNSILTDVIDTEETTIQRGFGLLESIPILSLNTNDFNGKDIAGKPMFQAGTNLKTAGRPIPGIAVQIVDPSNWTKLLNSNEVGAILVKGAQIAQHLTIKSAEWINGWFNTNMTGYLDENGFMHIVKASDETK